MAIFKRVGDTLLDLVLDEIFCALRLSPEHRLLSNDDVSDTEHACVAVMGWALVWSFYRPWNWLVAETESLGANSRGRMEESPQNTADVPRVVL